jgi:hypothetical protein
MDRQREGGNCDAGDRLQVVERVELRSVLEQRLGDVGGRTAEQQRVAIGSGARGLRRADRAAAAADVLDHDRAKQRFHSVRPRATDGVERPARREWNHKPYWPRRIGLRSGDPRDGRHSGNARCQMQEFAARKFHRLWLSEFPAP